MRTLVVLSMILGLSLAGAPPALGQNAPLQPDQPGQEQLLRVQKEAQGRLHELKAEQARIQQQQQELEGLLKKVQAQLGTPPPVKKPAPPRPLGQACPICPAQPGKPGMKMPGEPGMMMPAKPGMMMPGKPGAPMGAAQEIQGRMEKFAKALKQAQASQMSAVQKELAEVREQWARQQHESAEQLEKVQDRLLGQLRQMQEAFTRERLTLQQQLETQVRSLGQPQNVGRAGENEALQRQVQALQSQVRELQAQVRQLQGTRPRM